SMPRAAARRRRARRYRGGAAPPRTARRLQPRPRRRSTAARPRPRLAARRSPPQQAAQHDPCRKSDTCALQRILLDVFANLANVLLENLGELLLRAADTIRCISRRTPDLPLRLRNARRRLFHLPVGAILEPLHRRRLGPLGLAADFRRCRRHGLLLRDLKGDGESVPCGPSAGNRGTQLASSNPLARGASRCFRSCRRRVSTTIGSSTRTARPSASSMT